ncbi:MAG: DUF4838 domain-containing protein [Clostridia bacterium]|nr:DUF4838 domain-containing protein [Clostridia bacterium]
MLAYIKGFFYFIEVLLLVIGVIPVSTNGVDYGGGEYSEPEINTPMYIVEDGETAFVIVTADNADSCIMTAVEELQTYAKKISGAELEHVYESEFTAGKKAIVIGETSLDITDTDCSEIGEDGFLIWSDGTYLLINGEDSRGTLYGVYTLLEEYFGVRWFTPTLERVPESEDLVVDAAIDRIVEPSFTVRRNACPGTNSSHYARNKINVTFWDEMENHGGAMTFVLWDVTLDTLVPDSLFAEHPEYFAMNPDGTRTTDHVCLSHPEVLPIAIANGRQAILDCPRETAKYIHIGQKDNSNYCHCETCEALYAKYGAISAPTIIFTNAFADALDDEFPDMTFTFYAYGETDRPPTDLSLRCNKNVVPVLCGIHRACRSHPITECGAIDGNETFDNLFVEQEPFVAEDHAVWTKLADRTFIYDYTINFLNSAQFFSNLETMQSTMAYMHDIGITGYVYNCGDGHSAAFNELRNYLLCKLQWDVNADVEYLMMDFMNEYYGEEAAPYIKEILDIQAAQTAATAHAFDFDWHYQAGFYPFYKVIELDNLWNKALSADITEEQLFNVEVANLSWEYFKANQFIGKYSFLNPGRLKANEELYDSFLAHNIHRVSSFGLIPTDKSQVDFMLRPFNWG